MMKLSPFFQLLIIFLLNSCSSLTGVSRQVATKPLSSQTCHELLLKISSEDVKQANESNYIRRLKYIKEHTQFGRQITTQDNLEFIKKVRKGNYKLGEFFFHAENSILKILNDEVISDKRLTHAITNHYLKLLYSTMDSWPSLKKSISNKYFDYKVIRLGFTAKSKEERILLENQLSSLFELVNKQFEQEILAHDFIIDPFLRFDRVEIPSPDQWFRGGVGGTPDESALVAKSQRGKVDNYLGKFSDEKKNIKAVMQETEGLRDDLNRRFADAKTVLVENSSKHKGKVLNPILIDMLKKSGGYSKRNYEIFEKKFKRIFKTDLTESDFHRLLIYVDRVSRLTPHIYQEETTSITFQQASKGIWSVDMARLGAQGDYETMSALVGKTNIDDAIKDIRQHYWRVHDYLYSIKEFLLKSARLDRVNDGPFTSYFHSGDDFLFFPPLKWGSTRLKKLLEAIFRHKVGQRLRMVQVTPISESTHLGSINFNPSRIISHGENFLKVVRESMHMEFDLNEQGSTIFMLRVLISKSGLKRYQLLVKSKNQKHLNFLREYLPQISTLYFDDRPFEIIEI